MKSGSYLGDDMRKAVGWLICVLAFWDVYFGLMQGDFLKVQIAVIWLIIVWVVDDLWE